MARGIGVSAIHLSNFPPRSRKPPGRRRFVPLRKRRALSLIRYQQAGNDQPSSFSNVILEKPNRCVVTVVRQMLELVCERTGIDRYQAYTLLSVAADLRITQAVNGNKGVHLMLDKRYLSPVVER